MSGEDPLQKLFDISVAEKIAQHGYTMLFDEGEEGESQYIYTVGLSARGWPELLLIGPVPATIAQTFLKRVIAQWMSNNVPSYGTFDDIVQLVGGHAVRAQVNLVERGAGQRYTSQVARHIRVGEDYDVAQFLWPDAAGVLPGEPGYAMPDDQPLLPAR